MKAEQAKNNLRNFILKKEDADFWQIVHTLTSIFPKAQIYLVGGMARDIALGKPSNDYDFVIKNIQPDILETQLKNNGDAELVGKTFGVFKWRPKGLKKEIDIALPRTDHALGTGGYKDVKIQSDPSLPIEKDLERRDFTINAIAVNLIDGSIIDPFGGLADIEKNILKTVGSPEKRFQEDYSRLLRCLRFACQLNYEPEAKTKSAL